MSSSCGYISGPIIFFYLKPKCRFGFLLYSFSSSSGLFPIPSSASVSPAFITVHQGFFLSQIWERWVWWSFSACRMPPPQMQWDSTSNGRLQFLLPFLVHKRNIGDREMILGRFLAVPAVFFLQPTYQKAFLIFMQLLCENLVAFLN